MTLGEAGAPEALGTLPDNVHVERWWPQDQVMPHAQAIVGHGGFGTTMAALVAGVPQVVLPLFSADQFENAAQVAAVRAGVALQVEDAADRLAGSMLPAGPDVLDRLPGGCPRGPARPRVARWCTRRRRRDRRAARGGGGRHRPRGAARREELTGSRPGLRRFVQRTFLKRDFGLRPLCAPGSRS